MLPRDPLIFRHVLGFLRTGALPPQVVHRALYREAEWLRMPTLLAALEAAAGIVKSGSGGDKENTPASSAAEFWAAKAKEAAGDDAKEEEEKKKKKKEKKVFWLDASTKLSAAPTRLVAKDDGDAIPMYSSCWAR